MASTSSIYSSSPSPSSDSNSVSNGPDSAQTTSSLDNETTWTSDMVPLFTNKHRKTLDIGSNGRTLSASPLGTILQMSAYHPVHGIVVASPYAQFDGDQFNNPEYVRWYRSLMLRDVQQGSHGFGIRIIGEPQNMDIGFRENFDIQITYDVGPMSVEQILTVQDGGQVAQTINISSQSRSVVQYTLGLNVSVNRASYGQLTEGGPIPIPESQNVLELRKDGRQAVVFNSNLDARLEADLTVDGHLVDLKSQLRPSKTHGKPISAEYTAEVHVSPSDSVSMTARFRLFPSSGASSVKINNEICISKLRRGWRIGDDEKGVIIKRNLEYILGNCTVPVEDMAICLLADHVALPLGWNRDN